MQGKLGKNLSAVLPTDGSRAVGCDPVVELFCPGQQVEVHISQLVESTQDAKILRKTVQHPAFLRGLLGHLITFAT